jgi:propanol-preferring alcohol dehydrogenase
MPTMRAVQVSAPGADFELVEKEIPQPKEGEVLIKVEACGICHGDNVTKEGGGRYSGIVYPRIPGHEIVGRVHALGAGVRGWEAGQRVGVGWYGGPCHKCEACQRGDLDACTHPQTPGIDIDGGYAEYMVASARALTRIPAEFDSLTAAPLLCAGRTTLSALRASGAKGGDLVAIHGLGGLGQLAVQFARRLGYKTVALSRGRDKEELALRLGAHIYIDTQQANAAEELRKLGGAKVILATAPNSQAILGLVSGLGYDGQLIIVAAASDPMPLVPAMLFQGRRSIRGWVGSRAETADALDFCALTDIQPMIEVFPLEQAALAFDKMMTSKVHFRSVLKVSD